MIPTRAARTPTKVVMTMIPTRTAQTPAKVVMIMNLYMEILQVGVTTSIILMVKKP